MRMSLESIDVSPRISLATASISPFSIMERMLAIAESVMRNMVGSPPYNHDEYAATIL